MRVEIFETGGFANLSKTFVLDSASLDEEKNNEFSTLTQKALTELPESGASSGTADMMSYKMNIDGKEVSLDDGKLNNSLRALYNFVKKEVLALKKSNSK